MKKNKKMLIGFGILALLVVMFLSFKDYQPSTDGDVINIGAVFILTGSGSELGEEGVQSLEIAKDIMEEACLRRGLKVKFFVEDSKSTPQGALNAYNALKFKVPNFDYVISHGSFAGGILSEPTKKDGKILLSTGANAEPTKSNPYFVVNANDEVVIAGKFKEAVADCENTFVFFQDDDFGRSVLTALKKELRQFDSCPFSSSTDAKNAVLPALSKLGNKSGVIIIGYGGNTVNIIKNLRQGGFKGPIFGSSEMRTDVNVEALKSYATDISIMQYFMPSDTILERYKQKFGRDTLSVADIQTLNAILLALNSYITCADAGNLHPNRESLKEAFFSDKNMRVAPCVLRMHDQRIYYKMEFKEVE